MHIHTKIMFDRFLYLPTISHKNDNYNKCLSVKKQNQKVLLGKTSLVTTLSHIIERLCEQYMHTKERVIAET